MPSRIERLPPSAARAFWLGALALSGYGAYRLFLAKLLPATAVSNALPRDGAVAAGTLVCALFLYWLGRLRSSAKVLRGSGGRLGVAVVAVLGLTAAAACLQWRLPAADWDAASALPRLAGAGVALLAAAAEEIGFRGVLWVALTEGKRERGPLAALALGSLGFALVHAGFQGPWDLPFAAAAGLALGFARWRGASLLSLVLAHACMDGVDALWMSPSLSLGHDRSIAACVAALAVSLALWAFPPLEP